MGEISEKSISERSIGATAPFQQARTKGLPRERTASWTTDARMCGHKNLGGNPKSLQSIPDAKGAERGNSTNPARTNASFHFGVKNMREGTEGIFSKEQRDTFPMLDVAPRLI